jgi:hypothetical protein
VKVTLEYFKASGKWYGGGDFEYNGNDYYGAIDAARDLKRAGKLPGLVDGSREWHILVTVACSEVPHLIPYGAQ